MAKKDDKYLIPEHIDASSEEIAQRVLRQP